MKAPRTLLMNMDAQDLSSLRVSGPDFLEIETVDVKMLVSTVIRERIKYLVIGSPLHDEEISFVKNQVEPLLKGKTAFTTCRALSNAFFYFESISHLTSYLKGRTTVARRIHKAIIIGASTGGPRAIGHIIEALNEYIDRCVLIAIHMPKISVENLANRLQKQSYTPITVLRDGMSLENSRIYFAPGDVNTEFFRLGNEIIAKLSKPLLSQVYTPNIDLFFKSFSESRPSNTIAALLTGMGDDGAQGLLDLRTSGAVTITEAEQSCSVYGMPKVAYSIGASQKHLALPEIIHYLRSEMEA